jgi:molybdate transport system regulatory protein
MVITGLYQTHTDLKPLSMKKLPDRPTPSSHARILSIPDKTRSLDSVQLQRLERSFREWAESSKDPHLTRSRKRILLIFLLIRYTGGRLSEVLNLDPVYDIDHKNHTVLLRKSENRDHSGSREVQIPQGVSMDIQRMLRDDELKDLQGKIFKVDPAHVRRKFYVHAESIGIPRELGTPEAIRRSRAVELMQSNVPLPVVQKMLGHSTPNLAASYVEFSEEEIRQVQRYHIERESQRKTSARNTFFGKIDGIQAGDIQTVVEIVSIDGSRVCSVITNDSQARLGLKLGSLVVAEVKAPWVMLTKGDEEPISTAENRFRGTVYRLRRGKVSTEIVVRIPDGTELCSVVTEKRRRMLDIKEDDTVWAAFNAYAVVIHAD